MSVQTRRPLLRSRWLHFSSAVLLLGLACSSGGGGQGDLRKLQGELVTADGAPAQDYVVLGAAPETGSGGEPQAGGGFEVEVSTEHTSLLLAVPKPDTRTAAGYGHGKGLYLSPVFGPQSLVRDADGKLALRSGPARIDSTTTVLSLLFVHPMLAQPRTEGALATARWLVARFNAGWPQAQAAVLAFEAALAPGGDLAAGPFEAAMGALLLDVMGTLPQELSAPPDTAPASFPGMSLFKTASKADGAIRISAELDDPTVPTLKVDSAAGTNLDYLCVVRPTSTSDFPDGADSPAFVGIDRLRAGNTAVPIRSVFLGAKSYASYLDLVGNTIGKVTELIGGVTVGPNSAIPLAAGAVTEVRCFSGGYGAEADQPVFDFVQQNFRVDARSAFIHNVTAAAIEVFSALPGGDAAAKTDLGKDVVAKVVQQAVAEIEAKASSQGSRLDAQDIYEIIYNVSRAGLNELCDKASGEWQKGKLEKLQHFVKWGGKSLVRFINVAGRVANAGAAGSRAYALARPQSLLEYFLFAVEGEQSGPDAGMPPDAGVPPGDEHARQDIDTWLRGCRSAVDAGCIAGTLYCPGNAAAATQTDPDHECAVALGACLNGAGSSCSGVESCLDLWADCG